MCNRILKQVCRRKTTLHELQQMRRGNTAITDKKNLPSCVIGKSLSLGSLILCHNPSACDTTFYSHIKKNYKKKP